MNKTQKLTFAITLLLSSVKASDDNGITFGESVTAAPAFATNVGVDALSFGRAHQTRDYIDRNRNQGADASSDNVTVGEALMTPASGTLNIFSGQTHQQGRRNFHSRDEQQNTDSRRNSRKNSSGNNGRNSKGKRAKTSSSSSSDSSEGGRSSQHHSHNPFRDRGTEHHDHNHGHWFHHHEQYSEASE